MTDINSTRITVTVTACTAHPTAEPTMPAATCSVCHRQLHVVTTTAVVTTTIEPDPNTRP